LNEDFEENHSQGYARGRRSKSPNEIWSPQILNRRTGAGDYTRKSPTGDMLGSTARPGALVDHSFDIWP
jgi:hypothetical protein